ncbi:methyl-accepting chemotaxis protein [Cellulomonas oligotrophica]|uniref:Methyl-accepting chemotaxis protein n=1 Tax=Cellulomonas oligotrophica TaxID=931536 RepID=A0A7Y9FFF5_9CELL|nr:methyl-accepting chemotaxis protein [Cellulomonas oligotrophica]NYD86348.1 methyl-accepting chemotaxis protein [Cellulomonas oligotrophica]GIG32761.1 hypothetical protein Col01nite_19200 [Cellulomonas oligotrophica]
MSLSSPPARGRTRRFRVADVSVNVKILTAVGVAAVVALVVGLLGLSGLADSSASTRAMYDTSLAAVRTAEELDGAMTKLRLAVANQALSQDQAGIDKAAADAEGFEQEIRESADFYLSLGPEDEEVALLEDFLTGLDGYVQVRDDVLFPAGAAKAYDDWIEARDTQAAPFIDAMAAATAQIVENETEDASTAVAASDAAYAGDRSTFIIVLVVGLVAAIALAWFVARGIVSSVAAVRRVCDALERNDLTATSGLDSRDELGQMGTALDAAVVNLRGVIATIEASSGSVAGASEQLSANTQQIAAGAEETAAQAGVVSAAAEQVSRSVQTVAAASEQMGASIREIAQNAGEAARVAQEGVEAAETSTTTIQRLGDSSREISNVVKLITSIAEQTNLLALNATIEAARAGEAGKGFAVVAGEVKELAQETARATDDISRRVEAIQADTDGAVEAISGISGIIASISGYQQTIASAVEEQTATTQEISRSATEAASGSGEIAQNISGVAQAAGTTTTNVSQSQQGVNELASMAAELATVVSRFRV